MTQLQVAYQQLQETKRANEEKERIAQFEADTNRVEATLKEAKLPYEVRKLVEDADVSNVQKLKIAEEVKNLNAELEQIRARTDLTLAQKEVEEEKAIAARRQNWKESSGFIYIDNLINAITGGLGKSVSKLIGG